MENNKKVSSLDELVNEAELQVKKGQFSAIIKGSSDILVYGAGDFSGKSESSKKL